MDEGAEEDGEGHVLNSWPDKHAYKMQAETPKLALEETRSNIAAQHVKARHAAACLTKFLQI